MVETTNTGFLRVVQEPVQQLLRDEPADAMQGEELDDQTQQTLDFINEIETEERKTVELEKEGRSGLKVMNFGDLHREAEAKKNILSMPSLSTVLN